ncbi:MAG: SprB repeat-containing protein [Flavobacteriales bacterium]
MTRPQRPYRAVLLLCAALLSLGSFAQQVRYWVGGAGEWDDARHWSATPGGPGGAGAPRADERAVIEGPARVHVGVNTQHAGLSLDGTNGEVAVTGDAQRMRVRGGMAMRGAVRWSLAGTIELDGDAQAVNELDLRGIPLASDVRLVGGTWSMKSDFVLSDARTLTLVQGDLSSNGNLVRAGGLRTEGRRPHRLIAGASVVMLEQPLSGAEAFVEPGASRLVVDGAAREWGGAAATARAADRNINICGTGAGQTLFTIDAQLISNYNGFGVSCHGVCNGRVQVTVSGGVGPFTYSWIGGPTTATWNNVCPGNQIVIVTDRGQGVSCATTVQVTDPALLSVIFFGNQPPTCSTVCNGSSNALAVGGVPGYTYNWNNGAGSGSSFNQLCPGSNTLHVTDANNCAFDTTFLFPIQPISPHLTVTNAHCSGSCDGTAVAAPTGGTGTYNYNWQPAPGSGQGTATASGLCPGAYSLTISDVNGCDTTVQFQITAPPSILPNATHVNATCSGRCDGRASVAPTGATGPFTYLWTPAPGGGQGTAAATGLCAGSYTVNIRNNATNCDTTVTIVITSPPAIIPGPAHTDLTCANACDGTASVAPTGGTPGYSYVWTPLPPVGQGTPNVLQLCAGTWAVRIADAAGCDTTVRIAVQQPPPLDPHGSFTDITCSGQCNGTASVAPTGGTGAYTYQWAPNPPAGQGTPNASQLCPGNWRVTVRDAAGCDTTITFELMAPPPLQVTPAHTNVTCGPRCDGTASVAVTGGTPGYTYSWSPAPPGGQGTANATGLCAGTWTVTVTDAKGCTRSQAFNILPAVPLRLSLQVIPATCPNVCDGRAGVIVTGGSAAYTYAWSPAPGAGQGTANVTGLCPRAYSLKVTDALGCDTTISFTVNAPLPIVPNGTVNDASCHGACDGRITLVPVGGSGSFTYQWTPVPPNGQGTPTATGLCAGSYRVRIASGACDTTVTFQVQEPPAIRVAMTVTPTSCARACNGSASANASGGTPALTYTWSPAPGAGQGTPTATGLCPGDYTLTVADRAGCDTTLTFTITAPPPIQPRLTTTNASCGGGCDGTASVAPTGGTGAFAIRWSPAPGAGQGTPNATGLCVGAYTVTLTDAAGCDTTLQFNIATPSRIVAMPSSTDASCANSCDGAIGLATSGGLPPYTYAWSPAPGAGQGTPNVTGLCPGDRTVTVKDAAGCDTTLVVTIHAPTPITPNGSFTNGTCNGPCDGTATVAPAGGSGGYSFNWAPAPATGQGTSTVSGLCPGNWRVTITDAAGCDTTWAFTVLPAVPITGTITAQPTPCAGTCGGTATVSASGGTGGYTYQWSPAPGGGQGTATATGLCVGAYSVTVTDAVGCNTVFTATVGGAAPIAVALTITDEDCSAACTGTATAAVTGGSGTYTFAWQPSPATGQGTGSVTGLCAGTNYTLTVTDANGCNTTVAVNVQAFDPIRPNATMTPPTCATRCDGAIGLAPSGGTAPYTVIWSPIPREGQGTLTATGLCAGDHEVTITDAHGCDVQVTLSVVDPPPVIATAVVQDLHCNSVCDGRIDVTVAGGPGGAFSYTWSPAPPAGQGTPNISGLCAGDWHLTIGTPNGCDTTITWTVNAPPPLTAAADITPSHCTVCDGSIFVHVSGGTPGYTFAWGPPSNTTTTDSLITGLCAGIHSLTVTDAAGCAANFSYAISDPSGERLTMTDGSTSCPNRCDGQVSVAFACSAPACTIAWSDGTGTDLGRNSNDLDGLCAGIYLARVMNGDGCMTIDTATVAAPPAITTGISSTPVSCAGDCDGTATVGISGGTAPFTLTWTPAPGAGQGTPHTSGLCPGPYDIHIADAAGCDTTYSVLILAPLPVAANATVTDISCAGQCDGRIDLHVTGGTGAFTYLWSPPPPSGQGTSTASALCPGTYDVLLRDANGCDTTLTFTLTDPSPIVLTPSTTPSQCAACNGAAAVAVAGGTGPVNVTWTNASGTVVGTGDTIGGLCAGLYTARAQDSHGCAVSVVVAVGDLNGEALTMIDGRTLCATACDAQVGVTFTCTTGPCTITWYDADAHSIAQNTFTVTDLCPGLYIAEVSNAAGCTSIDTAMVTPSNAIRPNLSTTAASCAGACDGTATVGPVGGVAPYTYDWSPDSARRGWHAARHRALSGCV